MVTETPTEVAVPLPATVAEEPETVAVPLPATVPVPASVPAGDGSSNESTPMAAWILLAAGVGGLATAATWLAVRRQE